MGVTKRAGRKKDVEGAHSASSGAARPSVTRAVFEGTKKKEVGVTDLTLISKISNEAINENLKKRFENAHIYTYIGHVLVSVNPFRDLGIYTDSVLESYKGKNRLETPPHVFAIAESAYYNMKSYKKKQCVIISGESGAGKTEAAKRIMQYIASVSGGSDTSIQATKEKVLATNPLLESFGNAKTLRNNNSSRFGKYLELQFNEKSEPVGANITNYLLEKSRVVNQVTNERNFHIFYQFTKAASAEHRKRFNIYEPRAYEYLNRSSCFDVDGIDDVSDFRETLKAMETIKLGTNEQNDILSMLAAILWIGNISFTEDDHGNASISEKTAVKQVADLLALEPKLVSDAMTLRVVETSRGGRRGSVYEVPLNTTQATAVRDALAKAIYFNLFDWIVARTNEKLKATGATDQSVGILDIYGFEIFERNSFEQLCINYVNEKLQQIFIQLTLKTEQEEYAREQIQWTPIKYFDNKIVCDLIEGKRPPGIFAALNDSCATAHADSGAADQTFVQRLNALSTNPHFQPRQGQFVVKHYAGDVNYAIDGMTDKNKDQLLKDLLNLMKASKKQFVQTLFPGHVDQDDKRRPPTAGDKIKASANDLVATLMKASPSYIRTIKPNDNKSPTEYNTGNVMHQIKYLGLQENVRIRRAGFAYRQTFDNFLGRFFLLSRKCRDGSVLAWNGDAQSGTQQILKDTRTPPEEYQLGVTKVFIKTPETIFALESRRDKYFENLAIAVQRRWRKILKLRLDCVIRVQKHWREVRKSGEYQRKRDYGHQILQGRKERRRFSLIGSRRYLGDYLGVNNDGGYGQAIRSSISLNRQERALFSCRCDLLVTKFGRSSKPEQRILILTGKAVYVVLVAMVNKEISISSERTIPLGTIKYVSTSILKDDWFSLGVSSPQQPDPLINCVFKTEFFTHLKIAIPGGGLDLRISEAIMYNKKPGKPSTVKVVKDPSVQRDDFYKSGTIHTNQGEPASSSSRPTPKGKLRPVQPITHARTSRPGGPLGGTSKPASRQMAVRPVLSQRNESESTPAQASSSARLSHQPAASQPEAVPQASVHKDVASHKRNDSSIRAPPPPPPAAPSTFRKGAYRVLYDYGSRSESEFSLQKDEIVQAVREADNGKFYQSSFYPKPSAYICRKGWYLVQKSNQSTFAWAPSSYLKEEVTRADPPPAPSAVIDRATSQPSSFSNADGINGTIPASSKPAVKSKPPPPAPPKRPGVRGKKPAPPPTPRDSAVSMGASSDGSGRNTPNSTYSGKEPSMAETLAVALRARETSKQRDKNGDDDCVEYESV
ncbi:MAG: hypothetical protein Q9163_003246 [Psora crenata]